MEGGMGCSVMKWYEGVWLGKWGGVFDKILFGRGREVGRGTGGGMAVGGVSLVSGERLEFREIMRRLFYGSSHGGG